MQQENELKVIFADRLRKLIEDRGLNQKKLAELCDMTPTAVSYYVNGLQIPGSCGLHAMAQALGVTMEALLTGTSTPPSRSLTGTAEPRAPSGVVQHTPRNTGGPYWGTSGLVPIISWARAGQGHYYEDQGYDVPHIPTACKDPNCYALTIVGDSMEPSYWDGDIVVVIPHGPPVNNNLVIVKTKEDEVLFKVYQTCRDPKLVLLTSINTKHTPIWMHLKEIRFIHIVHSIIRTFQKKFGFTVHREHETEGA